MIEDPPRLFEDPSAPEDVRSLLRGMAPPAPMPEALLAKSGRRVAMMAAFPVFMAGLFKAKTAVAAVLVVAVTAVAVTSAIVVHERSLSHTGGVSTGMNVAVAAAPAPIPAPVPVPEATFTAAVAPETPMVQATAPKVAPVRAPEPTSAVSEPAVAASATPEDQLAEEVRLLQEAKSLVKTQPQAALVKTREHATRFPKGTLGLEREMVAVEALVAAGRMQDARNRATALRPTVKGTIYAARLDALVGAAAP